MTGKKFLGLAGLLGMQLSIVFGTVKEVSPSMGTEDINRILNAAEPGDTIMFTQGIYTGPFVLEGVQGRGNLPAVITGIKQHDEYATVIDGQTEPGISLRQNAFSLQNCAWISIENFSIRNCWTDLIRAENTSYLSIRKCKLSGGKRALFATGRKSHHFLMEHCYWEQDERVWTHTGDFSWDEIHHGIHRHYNGSLFQGSGISGVIVLRDNEIRNTFNAFRLSQINDGKMDPLACSNVEIYRNRIYNTSDNVLEPEVHTRNLHYYHNQMINGHAFISITEVAGGDIYIYGNTAVSLPDSEDGWTIFKISSDETSLSFPFYIFNNSWQVDFDMIGSPRNVWKNNHIRHFNNACYSEASDTFGIYNLGEDNHFDFDCSNVPFPALLSEQGFEKKGIVANPMFMDPYQNNFKLQANSPCIDRGTNSWGLIQSYHGENPDIGAYDNGKLVEGPAFRYISPEAEVPFEEMPRITKYKFEKDRLTLWFSMPMDKASLSSTRITLCGQGQKRKLELIQLSQDAYSAEFLLEGDLNSASGPLLVSDWPQGINGMQLSSWASALPVRLTGQTSEEAMNTTRLIADKIIRETSFETQLLPLTYNAGIISFSIEASLSSSGDDQTYYAFSRFESEKDSSGLLGLSFEGNIKLFLNGEEIQSGKSQKISLQEYTYNRYRFQHRIPVHWKKGVNEVLVKCYGEDVKVLLLPIDHLDAKEVHVNALSATLDTPHTHWLINGPWVSTSYEGSNQSFPPESGFQEYYTSGEKIMAWTLEEVPLLRDLIIQESNSYLRDAYADWHYANGGTMLGILSLFEASGDQKYHDFVKTFAHTLVDNYGYFQWQYYTLFAMRGSYHRIYRMTMLDDSGGPALPLSQLKLTEADSEYLNPVLDLVLDYVMEGQERLNDRTFSRPEPEDATVWADDLFMSVPFLLRMAQVKGDETLYDEVARQVIQFNIYLSDPATGLYFHGWYNNRDETTPVRWGRANGWIVWATSEALLHMPEKHPKYKTIRKIYKAHMEALASYQDDSGMWHQVIDHPETFEETSCTAMFSLGLARGVLMGWLNKEYKDQALKGWNALQKKIGEDGTVIDICRGTGIGEDVEFYETRKRFDHDPRGLGAMLTLGVEISKLLDQ